MAPVSCATLDSRVIQEPDHHQDSRSALDAVTGHFPTAVEERNFIRKVAASLLGFGFTRDNCIALVNTCRDELCRPLVNLIENEFGFSFNVSALGGLVNFGKTGMKAAMSHSPLIDSGDSARERYVFFAFPHVSVGDNGEVGTILRRGRDNHPSHACGALIAILEEVDNEGNLFDDPDDLEYALLKKKVLSKVSPGNRFSEGHSLVDVTKAALQVIVEDLEHLIAQTVNPAVADYAVVTGIQIHSGNQVSGEPFKQKRIVDYVAPSTMYAVVNGQKKTFHCGA